EPGVDRPGCRQAFDRQVGILEIVPPRGRPLGSPRLERGPKERVEPTAPVNQGARRCQSPFGRRRRINRQRPGRFDMAEAREAEGYADFIRRIREGDERAAEELVRLYEPEIRLEIRTRMRLRDQRLRRLFDSLDVCQSVLASFFVRAAVGEFDLDDPGQLVRLLVGMARNKLAERVRHHHRHSRGVRRTDSAVTDRPAAAADESPSQAVAGRELLAMFHERLTPEERQVADLRAKGLDWAAVAGELGGTPEARRKQYTRAVA